MKKKTIKLEKKLLLNKEQISSLDNNKTIKIAGGGFTNENQACYTVTAGGCGGCLTPGGCQTRFGETCVC